MLEFLSENDTYKGHEEHFAVKPPRTVLQVVQVQLQTALHLFHCVGISEVMCCIAGDPGSDLIQEGISGVVLHNLVYIELPFGAVAYKGHVACEYIP